jgi:hypothetical protein
MKDQIILTFCRAEDKFSHICHSFKTFKRLDGYNNAKYHKKSHVIIGISF